MSTGKLLGSIGLKLRVALASLAVLVTGALIAPRATPTVLSVSEERAAPLLEQQTLSREAAAPFAGLQQVPGKIGDLIVVIPAADQLPLRTSVDYHSPARPQQSPAGFGVVVTPTGDVLTHADALGGRNTLSIDAGGGRFVDARVVGYEPATGLVLLSTAYADGPLRTPIFASSPQPGTLAAAFFRASGYDSVVPVFITTVRQDAYGIAPTGASLQPGTPIYNVAGELLAMATGSAARPIAIPAQAATERMLARIRAGAGQPASIGVRFQPLAGALTTTFGERGALIADTIPGSPAAAGLEPGDVVTAIRDTAIDSPEAAHRAIANLPIGVPSAVRVLRGKQELTLSVTAASVFEITALADSVDAVRAAGAIGAGELFSRSSLHAAGVPADARVIRVNGRAVSSRDEVLRVLRRSPSSVLLYVEGRTGERFFALIDQRS